MDKSKHTPKFTVSKPETYSPRPYGHAGGEYVLLFDHHDNCIGELRSEGKINKERIALITISSDLLAACEKMRHFLQWHVPETGQPNTAATALDDYLAEIQKEAKNTTF